MTPDETESLERTLHAARPSPTKGTKRMSVLSDWQRVQDKKEDFAREARIRKKQRKQKREVPKSKQLKRKGGKRKS